LKIYIKNLFRKEWEFKILNGMGYGLNGILQKGIPKLAKIGKPDFLDVCLVFESEA